MQEAAHERARFAGFSSWYYYFRYLSTEDTRRECYDECQTPAHTTRPLCDMPRHRFAFSFRVFIDRRPLLLFYILLIDTLRFVAYGSR